MSSALTVSMPESDSDRTENSTRDADSAFIDDTEQAEEATRSDSDHTESSAEHTDSSTDDSEQTAAAAEEAAVTLRRMRYRNRTLKEHFRVFVQYIAELRSEPDLLSKASHDDRMCPTNLCRKNLSISFDFRGLFWNSNQCSAYARQ